MMATLDSTQTKTNVPGRLPLIENHAFAPRVELIMRIEFRASKSANKRD